MSKTNWKKVSSLKHSGLSFVLYVSPAESLKMEVYKGDIMTYKTTQSGPNAYLNMRSTLRGFGVTIKRKITFDSISGGVDPSDSVDRYTTFELEPELSINDKLLKEKRELLKRLKQVNSDLAKINNA